MPKTGIILFLEKGRAFGGYRTTIHAGKKTDVQGESMDIQHDAYDE
jgi:hypothetical protein